jgi:heat shock protein HslJ
MTAPTVATSYRTRGVGAGLLAVIALVTGCGEEDGDGRDDPTLMEGRELVEGTTLSLTFDRGDMSAVAGCNTLFGPFVDADSELRWINEPASTMMGCDPALSEQDDWLRTVLTEGLQIVDDDEADLVLEGDGVRIEMTREEGGGNLPSVDPSEYSANLNGPSTARPGRVVLLTVSNLGTARDSYGFTIAPDGAGKVRPRHLTIEPGRSGKLKVKVISTPVTVEVESVGAGPGIETFTIR